MLIKIRRGLKFLFETLKLFIAQKMLNNLITRNFNTCLIPILLFLNICLNICLEQALQTYHILVFHFFTIFKIRLSNIGLLKDSSVYLSIILIILDFLFSY